MTRHVTHLHAQGRTAGNPICRYHTENGLKCAVGVLIPDDAQKLLHDQLTAYVGDAFRLNLDLAAQKLARRYNLEYAPC